MLEVKNLRASYGNIEVLKGISFEVPQGSIVCLIGANGAGKTTTLSAIVGAVRRSGGDIFLEGQNIGLVPPEMIVRRGISLVPEGRRIFTKLTVLENLEMGAYRFPRNENLQGDLNKVFSLFPILKDRLHQTAGTLSGGEQQMLAIGRALMSRPRLLLLDEPSMGLAPKLVHLIFEIIKDIHAQGTTILLVEQNAHMALSVADKGYVIENGRIVLGDKAEYLKENPLVQRAYLGG